MGRRDKILRAVAGRGRILLCAVFLMAQTSLFLMSASAQTAPEYRLEAGVGLGLVSYQGDFNSSILKNQQPMYSLLAKYRLDPRRALALNISYGDIKGSSRDEQTYYPDYQDYSFKNSLADIGLRFEYNFWPYGTGSEYRGAKRLTPYIFIGLGATVCKADKTVVTANIPLGGGLKYKLSDRVNTAVEWAMHFSGSDRLDGVSDPYRIKSSGIFKNTDCYSQFRLSLTYDLWAKCKTCHNDRD